MMTIFIDPVNCGESSFLCQKRFQGDVRHGFKYSLVKNVPIPDKNTPVFLTGSCKTALFLSRHRAANSSHQHLSHFFRVPCCCLTPWHSVFNKPVWEISFETANFRNESSEENPSGKLYTCYAA